MQLLVLFCLVTGSLAQLDIKLDCPANSHFTSCGTACPKTCENYQNPPTFCVLMCKIGCECDEGFVKAKDGSCVLPEHCPEQAVAKSCTGEAETGLCDAYFPSWYYDSKTGSCKQFVYGGCGGNGNRYATEQECLNTCADNDLKTCPANSHFESCGTACPLTCQNYLNPPKVCVAMCKIGCHCDEGYVLAEDGSCVLPEHCPAQAVEKSCTGEGETGLCQAYFPSWYYDSKTGSCKQFVYGGCGGNGNRYSTEQECLNTCADNDLKTCPANSHFESCGTACPLTCENYLSPPKFCVAMCKIGCHCDEGYVLAKDGSCVLPEYCPAQAVEKSCAGEAETGYCRAYVPSWYYDSKTGSCKQFVYGGCGGNGNRYATEHECLNTCTASEATLNVCDLTAETGVCKALFQRYAYDRTTGQCKQFIYGGCGGNANNFRTAEECENACPVERALDRPDCDKKPEVGHCFAAFPRFYYDQEAGMCKTFIYGGCGGNRNNFQTESECYNKCGALVAPKQELCEQERETGLCRGYFPRYYYNKLTGECERFIYGGCGGNDNNFSSKDNCEQTCKA